MTPRRTLIIGGACVALLCAFAAGWAAHPDPDIRIDERGKETASVQTVEVYGSAQEWVTRRDYEASTSTVSVAYRHRRTDPSGATEETTLDVTGSASQVREVTQEQGSRQEQAARVEKVEVVREVERRMEVSTPGPDWRIAGLVGYDGGAVYGAAVDRRILGPITVGAWGLSSGVVGVGVGVMF